MHQKRKVKAKRLQLRLIKSILLLKHDLILSATRRGCAPTAVKLVVKNIMGRFRATFGA